MSIRKQRYFRSGVFAFGLASLLVAQGCKPSLFGKSSRDEGAETLEAWDNATNNPRILLPGEQSLERRLKVLMGQQSVMEITKKVSDANRPWTDSYWPNSRGGIAYRWNVKSRAEYPSATFPKLAEVKAMSMAQRAQLSPSEKFDIYMGAVDASGELTYPLSNDVLTRQKKGDPKWMGLCNGWATAALNFKEPKPFVTKSAQDVELPFGSADLKALYAFYFTLARLDLQIPDRTQFLNTRCNHDLSKINPALPMSAGQINALAECKGVNAGSFHLVLANLIGRLDRPMIADLVRGQEIWNYPVHSFSTKIIWRKNIDKNFPGASTDAEGTTSKALVETTITYKQEIDPPTWNTLENQPGTGDVQKQFSYVLELNRIDEIIGGEWKTDERPDFLWSETPPPFLGYFRRLANLGDESQKSGPVADYTAL